MNWEIQTTKWKKLDLLERRLKELGASGVVGHQRLGRIVSSFTSGLEETNKNLGIELATVLSRIGVNMSSAGVATAASTDVAPDGSS